MESGRACTARWRSEKGAAPPKRVQVADDSMTADTAYRLACEGTALLWRGDYQNAKLLLQALARRADKSQERTKGKPGKTDASATTDFHQYRLAQSQRARTLGMLLLPLSHEYVIPLRRAPDVRLACAEAYGAAQDDAPPTDSLVSMRELLGLIGAHEWRKKGVEVAMLNGRIHPHYGVFAPVRAEYLELVRATPLPAAAKLHIGDAGDTASAFDIGTGTGVLAAILARRKLARVIATDMDPRALACANENIARLNFSRQVQVVQADLFPPGRASLIVCNPPWIPARPSSPIEAAIFDPESRMLRGFIEGLAAHLTPEGEGWLILSDIAEHLGLRSRETLLGYFSQGGLSVIDRVDARPMHPRVSDTSDALHAARAAEVTSLWRLRATGD